MTKRERETERERAFLGTVHNGGAQRVSERERERERESKERVERVRERERERES